MMTEVTSTPPDGSNAEVFITPRRFRVISTLGMGSFGIVHKASIWGTAQSCALKTISKDGRSAEEVELLKREIRISRELMHPSVVSTAWAFETANSLVVVQERALGDLFRILKDDERLPEFRVRDIARQLVSALDYIHAKRVIHRDLKPQNILVLSCGRVALCDFGFARSVSAQTALLTTIKGTPLYMAPEVVQEQPYNHSADIWSLGVILYELYQGKPPFWGESLVALVRRVVRKPFIMPAQVSPEFASFLNDTLEKDPSKRIGWPALASHPFVTSAPPIILAGSIHEGRVRLAQLFTPQRMPRAPIKPPSSAKSSTIAVEASPMRSHAITSSPFRPLPSESPTTDQAGSSPVTGEKSIEARRTGHKRKFSLDAQIAAKDRQDESTTGDSDNRAPLLPPMPLPRVARSTSEKPPSTLSEDINEDGQIAMRSNSEQDVIARPNGGSQENYGAHLLTTPPRLRSLSRFEMQKAAPVPQKQDQQSPSATTSVKQGHVRKPSFALPLEGRADSFPTIASSTINRSTSSDTEGNILVRRQTSSDSLLLGGRSESLSVVAKAAGGLKRSNSANSVDSRVPIDVLDRTLMVGSMNQTKTYSLRGRDPEQNAFDETPTSNGSGSSEAVHANRINLPGKIIRSASTNFVPSSGAEVDTEEAKAYVEELEALSSKRLPNRDRFASLDESEASTTSRENRTFSGTYEGNSTDNGGTGPPRNVSPYQRHNTQASSDKSGPPTDPSSNIGGLQRRDSSEEDARDRSRPDIVRRTSSGDDGDKVDRTGSEDGELVGTKARKFSWDLAGYEAHSEGSQRVDRSGSEEGHAKPSGELIGSDERKLRLKEDLTGEAHRNDRVGSDESESSFYGAAAKKSTRKVQNSGEQFLKDQSSALITARVDDETLTAINEIVSQLFAGTSVSERYVSTVVRTDEARNAFMLRFLAKLETIRIHSVKPDSIIQLGLRIVRRMIKAQERMAPPPECARVLITCLVAGEDSKGVAQGLKCLDMLLAKDASQVVEFILKPTQTPRVVECPLVPRLLQLLTFDDPKLFRASTRVSLALLSVPSGWRIARLFSSYITHPVMEKLSGIIADPAFLVENEVKSELLRFLSRLCACPSGPVATALGTLPNIRNVVENVAFDVNLHQMFWPALSVLEYICRFGSPSPDIKERWASKAIQFVIDLARLVPPPSAMPIGVPPLLQSIPEAKHVMTGEQSIDTEGLFLAANAGARLWLEAQSWAAVGSPFRVANQAEPQAEFVQAIVTVLSAVPHHRDAETLFAVLAMASQTLPCSKSRWDALWKPTSHPNETVCALRARLRCLQAGFPTKAILDRLPFLLTDVLSKRALEAAEQHPRSLGGGTYGARRVCKACFELILYCLGNAARTLDAISIVHGLNELDGARFMVRLALRYGEEDPVLVGLFANLFCEMTKVGSTSRAAKALIEARDTPALMATVLSVDPLRALKVMSTWTKSSGPVFDITVSVQSMDLVMTRVSEVMDRMPPGESAAAFAKDLCLVLGNLCRKSGKYNPSLAQVLRRLARDAKFSIVDETLALAVGNAAYHNDELHEVLVEFVPRLVELVEGENNDAKTRGNAALALANLLRHGDETDEAVANSGACEALLRMVSKDECDLAEKKIILLSLGNFASRPLTRQVLIDKREILSTVLEKSKSCGDQEVINAALRIEGKLSHI